MSRRARVSLLRFTLFLWTACTPGPPSGDDARDGSMDAGGDAGAADGGQDAAPDVGAPPAPQVDDLDPDFGTVLGGTDVTISGQHLAGATITFGGQTATVTAPGDETLTVQTPAHAAGPVGVVVTASEGTATVEDGFSYVLRASPVVNGALGDWDAAFRAAENATVSNWMLNSLDALYVAYDDVNLYLGIDGTVEPENVILSYLDVDVGFSSGVADIRTLSDGTGALDDAISSKIQVSVSGFGAEFAAGTKGMASVANGLAADAGLRGLYPVDNFPWLTATVSTSPGAVEMALPWASLDVTPAEGRSMAVFVRLVDGTGQYLPNQTLPADNPSAPDLVGVVFAFDAR